jgi:hypothetical protein
MKKIINSAAIVIFSMVAFTILPATISAADMWAETPDLNDETAAASVVIGSKTFKYSNPIVDMWAKTPDLTNQTFVERQVKIFEDSVIAEK